MKILPWQKDRLLSRNGSILPFDKLEHFLLAGGGLYVGVALFNFDFWASLIVLEIIGIAWELKDGLVPQHQPEKIEGFSFKDLIANNAGFALVFMILQLPSL